MKNATNATNATNANLRTMHHLSIATNRRYNSPTSPKRFDT